MQIQNTQNRSIQPNFKANYVVRGTEEELIRFRELLKEKSEFNKRMNGGAIIRMDESSDVAEELVSTTRSSYDRVNRYYASFYQPYFNNIKYNDFSKFPRSVKLQKIFGKDAKEIKIYEAEDIIGNKETFDFVEGIMKQ